MRKFQDNQTLTKGRLPAPATAYFLNNLSSAEARQSFSSASAPAIQFDDDQNQEEDLLNLLNQQLGRMQPTLPPQSTGPADMDSCANPIQSMDWLYKKERIYLLAQFWQQVSPLFADILRQEFLAIFLKGFFIWGKIHSSDNWGDNEKNYMLWEF